MNNLIKKIKNLFSLINKKKQDIENNKHFLKHVTDIMLAACTSTKSIADVPELFPGYHSDNFKNWKLDEYQPKTDAQKLSVYEMQSGKDGDFQKIFGSLNRPIESLIIKQNQILKFVESYSDLLHSDFGHVISFLVERESDKARFVVHMSRAYGVLKVAVIEFTYDHVWAGENRHHRVVVPAEEA